LDERGLIREGSLVTEKTVLIGMVSNSDKPGVYVDQSKSIEMLSASQQAQKTVDYLSNHKALNEQFDVQFYGLGSEVQLIVDSLDQLKFMASQTRLDKIAKNNQNN
jgi:hypothetical protein